MSSHSITSSKVHRLLSEGQRFRNNFKSWLLKQQKPADGMKWQLQYGRGNIRVSLPEDQMPHYDAPEMVLMKKYLQLSKMYDAEKERRDQMPFTLAKKRETGKSAAKRAHDHLKSGIVARCKKLAELEVKETLEMDPEVQEVLGLDDNEAFDIVNSARTKAEAEQDENDYLQDE